MIQSAVRAHCDEPECCTLECAMITYLEPSDALHFRPAVGHESTVVTTKVHKSSCTHAAPFSSQIVGGASMMGTPVHFKCMSATYATRVHSNNAVHLWYRGRSRSLLMCQRRPLRRHRCRRTRYSRTLLRFKMSLRNSSNSFTAAATHTPANHTIQTANAKHV